MTETCERCGFNDYSNFLKAFTKATGVSPKNTLNSEFHLKFISLI